MARAIYKIINIVNGKFYVGSSVNTRRRFWNHKKLLRRNAHHCHYLQNAWNKHGEEAFSFNVIELIPEHESLEDAEDRWLDEHFGKKYCYNIGRSAKAPWRGITGKDHPKHGIPVSDKQKQKIRDAINEKYKDPDYQPRLGKKHSQESRKKISAKVQKALGEGRGGHFIPDEETRQKMSDSLKGNQNSKGFKHSDEEVEAIRKRMLGNTLWLGRKHSDESRAKHGKRLVELTTGKEFPVMNDAVKFYGMPNLAAILRSIKGKKQIMKGPHAGLIFAYADDIPDVSAIGVFEGVTYPTTRPEAKAAGAKYYFTGQPCKRGHIALRLTKGACMVCRKEDWAKENERRKTNPARSA